MDLESALLNFLAHTAIGAASVLIVILFAAFGIPRSVVVVPRTRR